MTTPEAPTTEAGRRLVVWLDDDDLDELERAHVRAAILAIEDEARAAIRAESSAEIERLRAALWKYGDHLPKCHLADYADCDCGWHEVFDALLAPHAPKRALAPADAAGRESYVTCGIDGCEFAVERGEGRTMALHQSEDHDPAYDLERDAKQRPQLPDQR